MSNYATELNGYERTCYFFIWTSAIMYSIYNVYLIQPYFSHYEDPYTDFSSGWSWIGGKQDTSDSEWKAWIPLMTKLIPWIFVHHLISYIIKIKYNSMVLCSWYIIMSSSFLCHYFGLFGMICIVLQPCLLCFLANRNSKIVAWLVHILFLFLIHFLKTPDGLFQFWLGFTDEEHYIVTLTLCWTLVRSISQSIDSIENQRTTKEPRCTNNYLMKVAYCLYLPTLFLGPLILYYEFQNAITKPQNHWDSTKIKRLMLNLFRYVFWIYFTELCMHFLYFNALRYHPEVVQSLNSWALYGLGYCMGQYFLNKYVIVYGINGMLCEADGIKSPPKPRCIATVHLYSDMWKYFDRGLYNFLKRYIYIPLLELKLNCSKLLATCLCFSFVFVWHGMERYIFTWSFLNFIGVVLEDVAKTIGRSEIYCNIQEKYLEARNSRRLNCILASPLLAMSAISNFYFFAGQDIGNIFFQRLFHESWNTILLLMFILYCCCNVSIDIKDWHKKQSTATGSKYSLL